MSVKKIIIHRKIHALLKEIQDDQAAAKTEVLPQTLEEGELPTTRTQMPSKLGC